MNALLFVTALALAQAQDRPNEADMFGGSDDAAQVDGGTPAPRPDESQMFGEEPTPTPIMTTADGGIDRDASQLGAGPLVAKFDSAEAVTDPLKVGGSLLMFGQAFWQEGRPFLEGSFSAPMILDVYLDGRPNDRLRAFANGRLQFDPTFPTTTGSTTTNQTAPGQTGAFVGLTPTTRTNPSVFLDQLWLRFDIARKVYFTVGRQKVRWGVSRIWYPTDFLNARPRDPFNPFDVRLGVNAVKVHVPVESLGWNFYAYGLLDGVNVDASGLKLNQLGGAVRAEFVIGPAEIGIGGVWQEGRRQRYAVDVSTAIGPFDVYAEAAFRDGQDFTLFSYPASLNEDNLIENAIAGNIAVKPSPRIVVQVSGGASFQFNYTDKNFAVVALEYFYNPVGYDDPRGYQVQTFGPQLLRNPDGSQISLDPSQQVGLYQGKHNLGLTLASPGIPGADWITVSLSNVVILNDPAALTRLDVIFRVLNFLSVQAFGSVFYGQTGGQLRFKLSAPAINGIANLSEFAMPGSGDQVRTALGPLRYPPLVQAGILLRLAI
jgi:hypothetical protein